MATKKSVKIAAFYVIAAGVLWGIISIFVRRLTQGGMTAMQITAARVTVGTVVLLAVILIKDTKLLKIKPKDLWLFLGTGLFSVVLFNVCYFYTMQHGETSVAVVLLYTSPIFVMLMGAVFFKEKTTLRKLVALAATVLGCVFVSGILGGVKMELITLLTGIGSGFFYASYSIFGRYAVEKYHPLTVTFYTFLVAMVTSVPLCMPGKLIRIVADDKMQILWILGIGVVCTVLPYIFYTEGLERMEAGKAAIMVTVEPLVGTLLGIIAYKESANALKIAGIVLIFAAVVFLDIKERKKVESNEGEK